MQLALLGLHHLDVLPWLLCGLLWEVLYDCQSSLLARIGLNFHIAQLLLSLYEVDVSCAIVLLLREILDDS